LKKRLSILKNFRTKILTFRRIIELALLLSLILSCSENETQRTEAGGGGLGNGQASTGQPQTNSTPANNGLGEDLTKIVVPKDPQINLPSEFNLTRADGQTSSLKQEFKSLITGSQTGVSDKSIVVFNADADCHLCLAAARKLVEMAQNNLFSPQKCKLLVFVDSTSSSSDQLRPFSESVGAGSAPYIYKLSDSGMNNRAMMSAFGKSKPAGPYAAVMTWNQSGQVSVTSDSSVEGVGKPFYDSLETLCR
jgi:hypothetical protein